MVRIRLTRMGQKKRPFYRLVAADSRAPRDGRFIEQLGYYDPMKEPMVVVVKLDRVDHWLSHGAQPSDTAAKLIERARNAPEAGAGVPVPPAPAKPPAPEAQPEPPQPEPENAEGDDAGSDDGDAS